MPSENGWSPSWVGAADLQWTKVPGANVNLQIRTGQPLQILRAYAADYNAYIEPLRDRDSACYTATNSVPTSNHLNGTAMDLNWDSHPFRVRGTFTAAQMKTMRELLDFYEGTIFWAGDWTDPIDEMHVQLGYDTYQNPATDSFIKRKIRSDGFSTFRRGPIPAQHLDVPTTGAADDMLAAVFRELTQRLPSRSIYRTPGEGPVDTLAGMLLNIDAMAHAELVERLARQGDRDALTRLARTAAGNGAVTDAQAIAQASAVLADIEKNNPSVLHEFLKG